MYTGILTRSIIYGGRHRRYREKISGEFRQIVRSIVILFDSLPTTMLAKLLDIDLDTVRVRLRCVHSVLDVPDSNESPIRLLHPSFRDFLLDQQRCTDPQLRIDKKIAHGHLFLSCLKLMSKHFKRDMCNLRLPGALSCSVEDGVLEQCIPLNVQYACRYWVYHLQQGTIQETKEIDNKEFYENGQVLTFLQIHFLHWLEALSLIRKMSEGVLAVKILESIMVCAIISLNYSNPANLAMPQSDANHDLLMFLFDAKRFILNHRSIIESAPLQIYCSALVFSPRTSRIWCQYWDQPPIWIKQMPVVPQDWNPSLQTLEGHSAVVNAIIFSPDGQLLASASDDRTVRLWDPSTGTPCGTLEGHSDSVVAVAFSPDGQLLASALYDKSVRLWDVETKETIQTLPTGNRIKTISFSSSGMYLDTSQGILEYKAPVHCESRSQTNKLLCPWYVYGHWVTAKTENILWLPLDYRARCVAVRDNVLALGHDSGRISFIKVDPGTIPFCELLQI